jgi:hypothetical protein
MYTALHCHHYPAIKDARVVPVGDTRTRVYGATLLRWRPTTIGCCAGVGLWRPGAEGVSIYA